MTERTPGPGWHIDGELLAAYAWATIAPAAAWSVEAHLPGCARCRRRVVELVDAARVARIRAAVVDEADRPRPGPLEQLLVRLGVAEHTARLLVATPGLRTSWLVAIIGVLAFAVAAAYGVRGEGRTLLFLALAPLLPVMGVAAAYGPAADPTYEISLAAPMSGFRLLLLRVAAVQTATIGIVAAASLALPGVGLATAAWLLPALALATLSLALSAWVDPLPATGIAAGCWLLVMVTTASPATGSALPFSAAGQLACAVAAVGAAIVLVLRREHFDAGSGAPARHHTIPRRLR